MDSWPIQAAHFNFNDSSVSFSFGLSEFRIIPYSRPQDISSSLITTRHDPDRHEVFENDTISATIAPTYCVLDMLSCEQESRT